MHEDAGGNSGCFLRPLLVAVDKVRDIHPMFIAELPKVDRYNSKTDRYLWEGFDMGNF